MECGVFCRKAVLPELKVMTGQAAAHSSSEFRTDVFLLCFERKLIPASKGREEDLKCPWDRLGVCALCSLCHCSGEAAQTPAADAKQGLALALTLVQISAHCNGWAQLRGRPCVSTALSCSTAPCG